MNSTTKHVIVKTDVFGAGAVLALTAFVASGVYNFAADESHTHPVLKLL